jgi:hypothetical protein
MVVLNSVFRVGIATFTMLTSKADIVAPIRTFMRMNHFHVGRAEKNGWGNCNNLFIVETSPFNYGNKGLTV